MRASLGPQAYLRKGSTVCRAGQDFAGYGEELKWNVRRKQKKGKGKVCVCMCMCVCLEARGEERALRPAQWTGAVRTCG
jgi:hypothetical protein